MCLIFGNVSDDPGYFVLQIARKFKGSPVRFVSRVLLVIGVRRGIREAISSMLHDDTERLLGAADVWLGNLNRSRREGYLLANTCLAMQQWGAAERILDVLGDTNSTRRTRARLSWQLGQMQESIALLAAGRRSRQQEHYESERQVLLGWRPRARDNHSSIKVSDRRTALYFATNSLPYTGSGYAQRTHSLLKSLQETGWSVVAATRGNYPVSVGHVFAAKSDSFESVLYKRILPFPAKHEMRGRIQQQTAALLNMVAELRPTVLHTTTDFTNSLSIRAVSEATGIPWVYEVRGQLADTWASTRPRSARQSERYVLFQAREADAARAADHVVTLGERMKQNLVAAGVAEGNITVLPNGIGDKFLEEPVQRLRARNEVALESDVFYVGTVSSLVPYEGLDTLLQAVALLAPSHPSLRVLIVGDGTERENLRNLAHELGIMEICRFPGRVPRDKAHLYHASLNAFAVPRKDLAVTRSVTPLKPVEALASGVPVLASDLPALRELIKDGENGHLIEAEDITAWAAAISNLVSSPDQAALMGRTGRDFVLRTRTWSSNAHRLSEIYENLISKPS